MLIATNILNKGVKFCINKDTVNHKEIVIRIKATDTVINREQHDPLQRILRAAFGQRKEKHETKRIELSVEERPIQKDTIHE